MNSAIGYGLILGSIVSSIFGAVVGLWAGMTRREGFGPWVRGAVYTFAACMILSNLTMVYALLSHDFSVKYVAQVGSKATPVIFTIVSLWSALEGSILFWGAVMGGYLLAFAWVYRKDETRFTVLSMSVMLAVATFFAFLIAGPANPWVSLPNPPVDGPGPNPLLQNHLLMIIHPPMLYLGYVGMTVPFGIASGALLKGDLSETWMVPLRKWTLVPWMFLTIGIILGGWWAYAVLGWGGYWSWDPVENASFVPWLTATAFMHSTMVLERKRMLKLWTLALALGTFVLTIVGTFMTRSGVFNSVHSFTQSDIGPTFLVFIAITLVFSIALLTVRGHLLIAETPLTSVVSREGSILVNNLVFGALTFTVLLGTIFPLVKEGIFNEKITVGEPYFNRMAVPGGLLILFLMGVGPVLPWGEPNQHTLFRQLRLPLLAAGLTEALCVALGYHGAMTQLAFALAAFATTVTLRELALPVQQRMSQSQEGFLQSLKSSIARAHRRFGGHLVHLGIVVIVVAIAASKSYSQHASGSLKVGEVLKVGDYQVRFDGLQNGQEPHRSWTAANVTILHPDGRQHALHGRQAPRLNYYEMSTDPVGSPSIEEQVARDIYISLLAYDPAQRAASLNAWVFPLVGWIWYSIPLLVLGTLIALIPQRKKATVPAPRPLEDFSSARNSLLGSGGES